MISRKDLSRFRRVYIERALEKERGVLSDIYRKVDASFETGQILLHQPDHDAPMSFWDRAVDTVASFGGSWKFIGLFVAVPGGWITLNLVGAMERPGAPRP